MTFTIHFSKNKSARSKELTLEQFMAAQPNFMTELHFVDSQGKRLVGVFRVVKAPYEERLPVGGRVMILEGIMDCSPVINGRFAVRYYPSSSRTVLVKLG